MNEGTPEPRTSVMIMVKASWELGRASEGSVSLKVEIGKWKIDLILRFLECSADTGCHDWWFCLM
jgi:hypothetical protein